MIKIDLEFGLNKQWTIPQFNISQLKQKQAMLPQRLVADVRTRSQAGFGETFNPVNPTSPQSTQLIQKINQHQTINHQIMINEFDQKLHPKPKPQVSPKKKRLGKIELRMSDSRPNQEVSPYFVQQKQTIYVRDPSSGHENSRFLERFQAQEAFVVVPDQLGRTDTTFYNDADRQSNRSGTQEAKQCKSTSSNANGKPAIIQKYDSVYLEPLNPDYSGTRNSQQVFSNNAEDMHEKACGPAEDNTDFSKEEFVVETDGLGEIYVNQTPPINKSRQMEKNSLVEHYSKKTEQKLMDKGRAPIQKRNQDIQSSLNVVDAKPKRAQKEGANSNSKNASLLRSFGATKGEKTSGIDTKQSVSHWQHEALYTLSQNSIGYEAGSVELYAKDAAMCDKDSKQSISMQHSVHISKFRGARHPSKNKPINRRPKKSVVKIKEKLSQHDKDGNSQEAKESYGPFAQKQLDLIKQESITGSKTSAIFKHLQSQTLLEDNDYAPLTNGTTAASPFIPVQKQILRPSVSPAPDIDDLLKSVTSSFKTRRQTEYQIKLKVEAGLPKLTKARPTHIDEFKHALQSMRNKSGDVSRSAASNTRSAFQNKLERFVEETRSELRQQQKEMNSTWQDFRSTKMHGHLQRQTPIFSQRQSEMGKTFQSGNQNHLLKLLPVIPDQASRLQSPSSYHQAAHTPSTISDLSRRQPYFSAKRKTEFSQGAPRSHIGLDDRVTQLLKEGQVKINQGKRAASIKPKRTLQLVQKLEDYRIKIEQMQEKAAKARAIEIQSRSKPGSTNDGYQVLSPWESSQPKGSGQRPAIKQKREYRINAYPGASGPEVLAKPKFDIRPRDGVRMHTKQSQAARNEDSDLLQSNLQSAQSHYSKYNVVLTRNTPEGMYRTQVLPKHIEIRKSQIKEDTALQRKKKSLDQYLQTPVYHNIEGSNVSAIGPYCPSQRSSPVKSKKDATVMLQISARKANHENNLHQRYPSAQFSNIGLLNPNSGNNRDIFIHILQAKEQNSDLKVEVAHEHFQEPPRQCALPAPFKAGWPSGHMSQEQYSQEFSQTSAASPGLAATHLGFKFHAESPHVSARRSSKQSGTLLVQQEDSPLQGVGNLVLNSKSELADQEKIKGSLSLVPLAEVPDSAKFHWHACSPLYKIGINKDRRFQSVLIKNKCNQFKKVKLKPAPTAMSGLVDYISKIINQEHKDSKNAELVKFLDSNKSRAEIVLSNRFIKQMRIAQHQGGSFSIDPTLVESVESINSDLIDVDDRRASVTTTSPRLVTEGPEVVTFSPGQLSSPASISPRPGVAKRPSKTVVFMKQDHNPASQRASNIQSLDQPLKIHTEAINEADSGGSSRGAASPLKRPASKLKA